MRKKYDTLVFIGRFSPFHEGHIHVIDEALKYTDNVIVIVGSSFQPITIRNPFPFSFRKKMIKSVFPGKNVKVVPISDYPYNDDKWIASVQSAVYSNVDYTADPIKIGLIGHNKDHTSYYLKMFPRWDSISVSNYKNINATDIRENLFNDNHFSSVPNMKTTVNHLLEEYMKTDEWKHLKAEYKLIKLYKKQFENLPYPPTFVTVDTVVVQSGHVLLIKRKSSPGSGLWALPGGFLDINETLQDSALRELKEETKIKVPLPVLRGSIKKQHTFDYPHRSARGRTLTTAYHIDLGYDTKLPKVVGSDDAEKAKWFSFKDIDPNFMFEDHWHIIDYFINIGGL